MVTNFQWDDPFLLSEQLSEHERLVEKTARQFAEKNLQPRIREAYRNESFDADIMRKMGEHGLLGCALQEDYGGSGLGYVCYGLIARRLEAIDSAYRSTMSVQASLVIYPIAAYGSDAQKRRYLPGLASGELIGCFGLTEPESGSDPGSMATVAEKTEGGYRLNGRKMWISNAPVADVAIVWAKLDGVIRGFIVEKNTQGVSFPSITGKLSLRASPTGEIVLADAMLGEEALLPQSRGLSSPFGCLNRARYGIAWGALGAAEACWHIALGYVKERKQFGRPLAANQLIQKKLADMQTDIHIGYQACLRVGRLLDEGTCLSEAISIIKRNSCLRALDAVRHARDMLGANGIMEEFDIMRHLCNLETVNTYEGTQDVHALVLGRSQTELQAFF